MTWFYQNFISLVKKSIILAFTANRRRIIQSFLSFLKIITSFHYFDHFDTIEFAWQGFIMTNPMFCHFCAQFRTIPIILGHAKPNFGWFCNSNHIFTHIFISQPVAVQFTIQFSHGLFWWFDWSSCCLFVSAVIFFSASTFDFLDFLMKNWFWLTCMFFRRLLSQFKIQPFLPCMS